MDSRSLHYKGRKFPICARCTGELIGIIMGIFVFIFLKLSWKVYCVLLIPLIIDGFIQRLTAYESNNTKRMITGIMFGCGLMCLFLMSNVYVVQQGYEFGNSLMK